MRKLLRHPKMVVAVCLALTVFFGVQLRHLEFDNSIRQFMPQKDKSYQRMLKTEDTFGSMVVTGVSIETGGESILTPQNISVIDRITKRFEQIPVVENVVSLTNIDYVEGKDGSLVAGPLVGDGYTGSETDIEEIKRKLTDWSEMYDKVIISDGQRATQIQVTFHKNGTVAEKQEMLDQIQKILDEETAGKNMVVRVYGDPTLSEQGRIYMLDDLKHLIPLVTLVVLLTLLFSFGTFDGTFLPLLCVLMATEWSVGLMAMTGQSFNVVSSVIPVALIAVGSAYGIHVLTHYYVALERHRDEPLTRESYTGIIIEGMNEVKTAIFLAGVTTIVGFISLQTSPIRPLHSFAMFTAIGVAFSLLLSVTFIPAMLAQKSLDKVGAHSRLYDKLVQIVETKQERRHGRGLYNIYQNLAGTKARMTVSVLIMLVVSGFGLSRLVVDTSLVNYFDKDSKVRKDIDYVDRTFAGTNSVYFTITAPNPGGITNPELLKPMDDMTTYLYDSFPDVGKIVSFPTFLKRMNQVMHIPEDASTIGEDPSAGDETVSLSGFGDETLSSFGGDEGTDEAETNPSEDPDVAYAKKLEEPMDVEDALSAMHKAYVDAGGKNATVDQIVTQLERQYNYNGMAYYEVPYDPSKYPASGRAELSDLVSQYLILFSGSLDQFNDDALQPTRTRIAVQLKNHSTNTTEALIEKAEAYAAAHFPAGYTLEATGTGQLEVEMTHMIIESQVKSLLFSLLSVLVILSIAFRSVWAGLLGCVPLACSILLNYMLMGFFHINLDLVTSIIASVAIGVGIDYTIHFLETYKGERAKQDDLVIVTKETFRKSGNGIVTNAMAVGFGFLVLCFSGFVVLRYIGILVAIVMFTSSSLAMTLVPGLLNAHEPKFIKPRSEWKKENLK